MALKAVLATKADVDALPEAVRAFYKESNGRYVLDAEGVVLHDEYEALNGKVAEFRDNNIKLKKDLEKFKDVDPVEYARIKTEIEQLKAQGVKPNEIQQVIADAVKKATEPLSQQVQLMQTERDTANQALAKKNLDDKLWKVGMAAGVREDARDFWLSEATKTFKLNGDSLVGMNGDQQLFSKKAGKAAEPLSPEEWALEIAPKQPSLALLYKTSGGGGANGGNKPGASGGRIVSADNPEAVSANLEAIAKGTMTVQ